MSHGTVTSDCVPLGVRRNDPRLWFLVLPEPVGTRKVAKSELALLWGVLEITSKPNLIRQVKGTRARQH